MSKQFNLAQRAQAVTALKTPQTFKTVDVPDSAHDFWSTFKKGSAVKTGLTNDFYLFVMPDFSNILMFIIYHCIQVSASIDARNHPKVSVPILVAYCLSLVYGHFLITDAYINPGQPHFAMQIKNDSAYQEYLEYLLTLPVPEFLTPILKTFTSNATSRRSNLWYLASFEGFTHYTHFGRFFPINLFTAMHDIAASSSSRANVNEIFTDLVSTVILSIKEYRDPHSPNTDIAKEYIYANFFATAYATTGTSARSQNTYVESKLNQVLQGLFNPVLMRAMQQKQAFSEVYISAPVMDSVNYNPYIACLAMTKGNIPELITIFNSVAQTIDGQIQIKGQLSNIYDDYSGLKITRHGYSPFPTPTWDAELNFDYDNFLTAANNTTTLQRAYTSLPLSDFATSIRFKTTTRSITWTVEDRPLATITRANPVPPVTDPVATNVNVTVHFTPNNANHSQNVLAQIQWTDDLNAGYNYSVPAASGPANATDYANMTHTGTVRPYKSEIDDYPAVKVLDPVEADTVDAHLATLCGLVIQSDEIYAAIVTHPHHQSRVEEDSAQFLGSAIPFRSAHLGTSFKSVSPSPTLILQTTPPTSLRQPALTLIRAPHVIVPQITRSIGHWMLDAIYPGLRRATGPVALPELSQTVISFTVRNRAHRTFDQAENAPANSPHHSLLVWSPYVFVSPNADHDWSTDEWTSALQHRHFLTNLRTIFGTDATLMEVQSGAKAMPTA